MTNNQKVAAFLRRAADRIEKSSVDHFFKATATGGEPVAVDARPIDEQPHLQSGPMDYAIFIGSPQFVAEAHHMTQKPPKGKK